MSESKHTPGPWGIEEYPRRQNRGRRFEVYGGDCDAGEPGFVRAVVEGDQNLLEANARLIAAVPELLYELKKADQILHNVLQIMTVSQKRRLGGMNASSGIYSEGVSRKYERTGVIAKAEGRA